MVNCEHKIVQRLEVPRLCNNTVNCEHKIVPGVTMNAVQGALKEFRDATGQGGGSQTRGVTRVSTRGFKVGPVSRWW